MHERKNVVAVVVILTNDIVAVSISGNCIYLISVSVFLLLM